MKIGIVCLGLIGGSILKSLAKSEHELFVVTHNQETILKAKKYAKMVSSDMEILSKSEIIFVAAPISNTLNVLDKLENFVNPDCIVLDCASVKEFVMKKHTYKFIGSHPMAGTENSGFCFSDENLFQSAIWVLTPFEDTSIDDIEKVKKLIIQMGAKPIIADAKEHDEAVALISHLPLLLSQGLMYYTQNNTLAKILASSGFRDMTRLAMSNIQMALDMMQYNSENIDNAKQKLIDSINFLKNTKDFNILSDIKSKRKKMYSPEGKNILLSSIDLQ